eukprot:TRINITY_DN28579_c0_g1_i1.p1 TRINITY_DN28579_c0_g1~~TRINITY_DN28579_c0_g1_i1.p1  ORF type:complete len:573 (-),score=63.39 TRINITY_DN28579_c0_g1_i1:74-1792(-)
MRAFLPLWLCCLGVYLISVHTVRRQDDDEFDYTFPFMRESTQSFCSEKQAFVSSFCFWVSDAKDAHNDFKWHSDDVGWINPDMVQEQAGKCAFLWMCSRDALDTFAEGVNSSLRFQDIAVSSSCKNDTAIYTACVDSFLASNPAYKSRRETCSTLKGQLDVAKKDLGEKVTQRKQFQQKLGSLEATAHSALNDMGASLFSQFVSIAHYHVHSYLARQLLRDQVEYAYQENGEYKKITCTTVESLVSVRRRRSRRRRGSSGSVIGALVSNIPTRCCYPIGEYTVPFTSDCFADCEEAAKCNKALDAMEAYQNERKELDPKITELESGETDGKSKIQGFTHDYEGNGCPQLASEEANHIHTCKGSLYEESCERACEKSAADHDQGCGVVQSFNPDENFLDGAGLSIKYTSPFKSWLREDENRSLDGDVSPLYTQDVLLKGMVYVKHEAWVTFDMDGWYPACLLLLSSDYLRSSVLYQYEPPGDGSTCDFKEHMSLHESFRLCDTKPLLDESKYKGSGEYDECLNLQAADSVEWPSNSKRTFCFKTGERQSWFDELSKEQDSSSRAVEHAQDVAK